MEMIPGVKMATKVICKVSELTSSHMAMLHMIYHIKWAISYGPYDNGFNNRNFEYQHLMIFDNNLSCILFYGIFIRKIGEVILKN